MWGVFYLTFHEDTSWAGSPSRPTAVAICPRCCPTQPWAPMASRKLQTGSKWRRGIYGRWRQHVFPSPFRWGASYIFSNFVDFCFIMLDFRHANSCKLMRGFHFAFYWSWCGLKLSTLALICSKAYWFTVPPAFSPFLIWTLLLKASLDH